MIEALRKEAEKGGLVAKEERPERFTSGLREPEARKVRFDVEVVFQLDDQEPDVYFPELARQYLADKVVDQGATCKGPYGMWIRSIKVNEPRGEARLRKAIEKVKPGLLKSVDQLGPIEVLAAELLEESKGLDQLREVLEATHPGWIAKVGDMKTIPELAAELLDSHSRLEATIKEQREDEELVGSFERLVRYARRNGVEVKVELGEPGAVKVFKKAKG
jgi:hypothetical protein